MCFSSTNYGEGERDRKKFREGGRNFDGQIGQMNEANNLQWIWATISSAYESPTLYSLINMIDLVRCERERERATIKTIPVSNEDLALPTTS